MFKRVECSILRRACNQGIQLNTQVINPPFYKAASEGIDPSGRYAKDMIFIEKLKRGRILLYNSVEGGRWEVWGLSHPFDDYLFFHEDEEYSFEMADLNKNEVLEMYEKRMKAERNDVRAKLLELICYVTWSAFIFYLLCIFLNA